MNDLIWLLYPIVSTFIILILVLASWWIVWNLLLKYLPVVRELVGLEKLPDSSLSSNSKEDLQSNNRKRKSKAR